MRVARKWHLPSPGLFGLTKHSNGGIMVPWQKHKVDDITQVWVDLRHQVEYERGRIGYFSEKIVSLRPNQMYVGENTLQGFGLVP